MTGLWSKRAVDRHSAARLEREAALLESVRHPGVIDFVALTEEPEAPVLVTKRVDGRSLDNAPPLALEDIAGLLAGLAATVADLHDVGVVHGAICPSHVILGRHGHAALCGFGYGGRTGEIAPGAPSLMPEFADPERPTTGELSTETDVYGLGAITRHLVAHSSGSSEHGEAAGDMAEALARLAARATGPVENRPTARQLATAVFDAVPHARLPRVVDEFEPPPQTITTRAPGDPLEDWRSQLFRTPDRRPRYRPRYRWSDRPMVLAIVVAAAATMAVAVALVTRARPEAIHAGTSRTEPLAPTTAATGATPGAMTSSTRAPPISWSRRRAAPPVPASNTCPPFSATLRADVDGDTCPEALTFTDGVLAAGDLRWAVGQGGDSVATGDWLCRGIETLALLRPSTGEVYRFDGWAAAGSDVTAPAVASIEGAVAVRAADLDGDGCHELVVDLRTGGQKVVAVPFGER